MFIPLRIKAGIHPQPPGLAHLLVSQFPILLLVGDIIKGHLSPAGNCPAPEGVTTIPAAVPFSSGQKRASFPS